MKQKLLKMVQVTFFLLNPKMKQLWHKNLDVDQFYK